MTNTTKRGKNRDGDPCIKCGSVYSFYSIYEPDEDPGYGLTFWYCLACVRELQLVEAILSLNPEDEFPFADEVLS